MSAEKKSSGLRTRLFSALILAPVVMAIIIYGSWPFIILSTLAIFIAFYEWANMARRGKNFWIDIIQGLFYLSFSYGCFLALRLIPEQGAWLMLCLFISIWASDSGAYFVGKNIGGPKMAPKLSPKKTWAGLGGAMLFSALALAALYFFAPIVAAYLPTDIALEDKHLGIIFLIGLMMGVVGQAGDLYISGFKRRAGLKDTGALIPGHGGLLDRIDSLLLVTPAFMMCVWLWLA